MSDLIDDLEDVPESGAGRGNAPEFSVSEISGAIKQLIEGEFAHVRIRGELGRISRPASGHLYMDLKDDRAVIAGIMWKGGAAKLAMRPEEGMEVVATGRLTTFPGQSKYQIVIESMVPAGAGALMMMLEKRKKMLAAEGLFDPARKKKIPYLPDVIGVVTSPSGAVIRDILHRLRDRFPRKVLIWPVAVQGEKCAPDVARAIAGFNALTPGGAIPRPDVIIVARGGGSLEDLWGFNEEIVARAAAASVIPLISAVGHETDTTLIDFVSDQRAPTPTAAAEMAVPVRLDLLGWTGDQGGRLTRSLAQAVRQRRQRLQDLSRALPRAERLLDGPRQKLDTAADRLPLALIRSVQMREVRLVKMASGLRPQAIVQVLRARQDRLGHVAPRLSLGLERMIAAKTEGLARRVDRLTITPIERDLARKKADLARVTKRLADAGTRQIDGWSRQLDGFDRLRETLGYKATLRRGYAVVRGDGGIVTTKQAAAKAGGLEIEFADGTLQIGGRAPKRSSHKEPPPEQGSLL